MADLTTLQARLEALEEAYARGVLTAEYDGRRITHFSDEGMLRSIQYLKQQIADAQGTRVTEILFETSKGNL